MVNKTFTMPGIYKLTGRIKRGTEIRRLSAPIIVNIDPRESVLDRKTPAHFRPETPVVSHAVRQQANIRNISHWFILCALGLLALELFVANRANLK